jgi:hypothetical protein
MEFKPTKCSYSIRFNDTAHHQIRLDCDVLKGCAYVKKDVNQEAPFQLLDAANACRRYKA